MISCLDILLNRDINFKLITRLYDKWDDINFSIVNFGYPIFMSQYTIITCIWCVYLTTHSIHHMINFWVEAKYLEISCCCKRYWNFCNTKSRLKAAFRKFYCRYKDIVCPYNLSLSQSCPTCFKTLVKPFIYTDFDYGMLRLPDLDCWLTARVTGQQGMPSSPRHLIPPLVYPEGFFNLFFFFFWITRLITVHYLCLFPHSTKNVPTHGN